MEMAAVMEEDLPDSAVEGTGTNTNDKDGTAQESNVIDEIILGGQKRKLRNVTRMSTHPKATTDIYAVGRAMVTEKNFPAVRLRRGQREKRSQSGLHDDLYRFQKEMGGDFSDTLKNLDALEETESDREQLVQFGF